MAFQLRDRRIAQIAVVGAGNIGPDIAFDFVRALFPHRVPVVLVDAAEQALGPAQARLGGKVETLIATGQLGRADGESMLGLLSYTTHLEQIKQANLIMEAVTEDLQVKRSLYERLEAVCRADALLLSTSAHLQADALFPALRNPRRAAVARYAYPADRNPLVELAPGPSTSGLLLSFLELLYELIGKSPVVVRSRYGHALSPVAEGLLLAGCIAVERGWATVGQIDFVCRSQLGQALGPFNLLNASGALCAAEVAFGHYNVRLMPWFQAPRLLRDRLQSGAPWSTTLPEGATLPSPLLEKLTSWMLGAYFAVTAELVDARLTDLTALDEAIGLGLAIRPPLSLMNEVGIEKALRLVERFAYENSGVKVGQRLREQAAARQPWPLRYVERQDDDEVAVLTVRRYKQLNALSLGALRQLHDQIAAVELDERIRAIVLKGFGTRAFCAGADVSELASLGSAEDAEMVSRRGQVVMRSIERLKKPVVAALGGVALGAGNELALACHARIATSDLPVLAGQPEPKLGLMPAYGGTQRLPRLIDCRVAWRMLRTGETLSAADALRLGLIRETAAADVLRDRAVELAAQLATGRAKAQPLEEGPIVGPERLPEVDLGGLSSAVDRLICDAVLEGMRGGLEHGLDFEARQFGKLVTTEDFRIGVTSFLAQGYRAAPKFVHR